MGFRFYRRVRILPGVRLNLSKTGASVSMGPRGTSLTIGRKGVRATEGLTVTGMYLTEQAKWSDLQNQPPAQQRRPVNWGWIIFIAIIVLAALAAHH